MVLKTVAIRRRSGSEKLVWTRGSSRPGCTAPIVDSSSRIGLKASRRMRKLATRMATSPMASRPSKDGNLVRPEKFRVISGPLTAPAAMMAPFATTTFWKVVRFRCHHRGSNEILTIHSRHRSETNLNSIPESVQAGAQSGARRMPDADHPAANWVRIRVRRSSLPLFCGPFPQRPAFSFQAAESVRENSSDGFAQLRLRAGHPCHRRHDRRTRKARLLPPVAGRRRVGQPGAGKGPAAGDDGAVARSLRAGQGSDGRDRAEHGPGTTDHPTVASRIHHADL